MGGGILEQLHLVEGPSDDSALTHDYRAHRNFLRLIHPRREAQRFAHEKTVALQIDDRFLSHMVAQLLPGFYAFLQRPPVLSVVMTMAMSGKKSPAMLPKPGP